MSRRSPAWDDIDDPEDIWHSEDENDMGYICGGCGEIPSFRELKQGSCSSCREARIAARETKAAKQESEHNE